MDKTFHSFAKLPYELRLEIWNLSIFLPRTLELRRVPGKSISRSPLSTRLSSMCGPPTSLSINRETRALSQGRYILHNENVKLFLDPSIDTLYLGSHCGRYGVQNLIRDSPHSELKLIKRLVAESCHVQTLGEGDRGDGLYCHAWARALIFALSGLDVLIIISKTPCHCNISQLFLGRHRECKDCEACTTARRTFRGQRGWRFPTLSQFLQQYESDNDGPFRKIEVNSLHDSFEGTNWEEGSLHERLGKRYNSVFKRTLLGPCEGDHSLWEWLWMYWHGVHETRTFREVVWDLKRSLGGLCDGGHEKLIACL
jgi:hypothetical protein